MGTIQRLGSLVGAMLIVHGCGSSTASGVEVTQAQYGEAWPFTVDRGVIDCVEPDTAIFRAGGETYALNGMATQRGYTEIEPIWLENPEIPGARINVGPFIRLALDQC